MSRIITTTVYTLHELSSTAQEKARDWYRQHHADSNWYENVYEDFREVCGISELTSASAFSGSATAGLWKSRASGSADSAARGTEPVLKDAGTGSQRHPGKSGNMPRRTVSFIVSRMPCRWCRNVTSGNCRLKSTTGDATAIRTAWISRLPGTVRLVRQ